VIEAAENEAQLAGVIAHEASHVALRHGTNQASKAAAAQMPLAILGGIIGSDSTKAALAQLGASFAMNSVLLKYSRTAESQADILGTQILYDSGYDPRAMGQFFQILEDQQENRGQVEFFSNHPPGQPHHDLVNEEVTALGGTPRNAMTNSRVDDIKRYLQTRGTWPGPATGSRLAHENSRFCRPATAPATVTSTSGSRCSLACRTAG
jgi:predicted Zn-dependent protease